MSPTPNATSERPTGVYFVALYLVVAGFLEAIMSYHESEGGLSLSPWAEQNAWGLVANVLIFLFVAHLVWNFVWLGRLAALVWCYAMVVMYVAISVLYLAGVPHTTNPMLPIVGAYYVLASIPVIVYLQPSRQKKVFHVSLMELLLSSD
jgi:hypothetical protein